MLREPSKELYTIQSHYFLPVVPVITITEANAVLINCQEPVVGYCHSVCVPAKVIDNLLRTGKRLFEIDNPGRFVQLTYEPFIQW